MKRRIIVGSNTDDGRDKLIAHPDTGKLEFVCIPDLERAGIVIPPGPAYLMNGWHGPKKDAGEGALHIWQRHGHEIKTCASVDDVPRYVANILTDRAKIFVGLETSHSNPDLEIVNPRYGKVVMYSKRVNGSVKYVVLTAYPDRYALKGIREYEKKGLLIGDLFPR